MSMSLYADPGTWRVWWLDSRNVLHWVVSPAAFQKWFGNAGVTITRILNNRIVGANIDMNTSPGASMYKNWSYSGGRPSGRLLVGLGTNHNWWLDNYNQIHWVTSPAIEQRYWGSRPALQFVPLHQLDYYVVAPNVDR